MVSAATIDPRRPSIPFAAIGVRAQPASGQRADDDDAAWQSWIGRVENMLGHPPRDLDAARAAFDEGTSVVEYALRADRPPGWAT